MVQLTTCRINFSTVQNLYLTELIHGELQQWDIYASYVKYQYACTMTHDEKSHLTELMQSELQKAVLYAQVHVKTLLQRKILQHFGFATRGDLCLCYVYFLMSFSFSLGPLNSCFINCTLMERKEQFPHRLTQVKNNQWEG